MGNYVNGHFIETCVYAIIIVVIANLCTYLLDKGEFVVFVTSVGWPARPADVGEIDDLNCPDDCNIQYITTY